MEHERGGTLADVTLHDLAARFVGLGPDDRADLERLRTRLLELATGSELVEGFDINGSRSYRIVDPPRGLVCSSRLNLTEGWPMQGPFQAIFWRNVMIAESLTGIRHRYRYIQPTIYEKA